VGRHARVEDTPEEASTDATDPAESAATGPARTGGGRRERRSGAEAVSVAQLRARLARPDLGASGVATPIGQAIHVPAPRRRRSDTATARPRLGRPLPLIVAVLVLLLTATAATVTTRLAFASSSEKASASTQLPDTTGSKADKRVSRDKRVALEPTSSGTDATIAADSASTSASADPLAPANAPAPPSTVEPPPAPTTETPPPVTWVRPTIGGNMTSCFCERWGAFHDGIDIDPPLGTPIFAVGDGVVVFAGPVSGYGIGIYIQHANGDVSFYGHEAIYYVHTGDQVTAGETIALVGNEGYSTGPHVHFGVYQGWQSIANIGNPIDPVPWLADRGIDVGPYDPNG